MRTSYVTTMSPDGSTRCSAGRDSTPRRITMFIERSSFAPRTTRGSDLDATPGVSQGFGPTGTGTDHSRRSAQGGQPLLGVGETGLVGQHLAEEPPGLGHVAGAVVEVGQGVPL